MNAQPKFTDLGPGDFSDTRREEAVAREEAINARAEQLVASGDTGMVESLLEADVAVAEMIEAAKLIDEMNRVALRQFNWGASALSGEAIDLLNRAPGTIHAALARVGGAK